MRQNINMDLVAESCAFSKRSRQRSVQRMKKHLIFKRWLKRIGVVLGLVVLLFIILVSLQACMSTQKLKSVHAQLERDAIPLSWSELHRQFPNVEAHLAAQSNFFAALDSVGELPDLSDEEREALPVEGNAELPELGSNMPPSMLSALDTRLHDAAPALAVVRESVANEPFWLVPPTNTFDISTLSRLATVRQSARLFNMSAILHSERDEPETATQAVVDGIRLAEVPHRGSLLIDELVRFACEGIAIRSLEYVLAKIDPSHESLRELESTLAEHSDMRTGILGEIVYTKQMYAGMSDLSRSDMEMMIELSGSGPWEYVIAYLPISSGWIRMNEAYHLELLHHVVGMWNLPWQDFTNRNAQVSDSIPWPYFLPNLSKDVYSNVKNRELRADGAWRCGRIAIAIERYSREHGGLPRTLTDLVPKYLEEIPVEPFHGQPFVYMQDGNTGTLRFSYPDSKKDFMFKVFASKESTEPETTRTQYSRADAGCTGLVIHSNRRE